MAEGPVGWPWGCAGAAHRFHTAPVMSSLCFLHPRGAGVIIPILWMRTQRRHVLRGSLDADGGLSSRTGADSWFISDALVPTRIVR